VARKLRSSRRKIATTIRSNSRGEVHERRKRVRRRDSPTGSEKSPFSKTRIRKSNTVAPLFAEVIKGRRENETPWRTAISRKKEEKENILVPGRVTRIPRGKHHFPSMKSGRRVEITFGSLSPALHSKKVDSREGRMGRRKRRHLGISRHGPFQMALVGGFGRKKAAGGIDYATPDRPTTLKQGDQSNTTHREKEHAEGRTVSHPQLCLFYRGGKKT